MAGSKYSFRPYIRGNEMHMSLTVRVPNSIEAADRVVKNAAGPANRFEETVSLDDADEVVAAIKRARDGILGGRINPLKGKTKPFGRSKGR